MTDIFKSVPAKGAIIIDATGENDGINLDIENGLGEKFHFEIVNKDEIFKPSAIVKPPSGAGKESGEQMNKHKIVLRIPK